MEVVEVPEEVGGVVMEVFSIHVAVVVVVVALTVLLQLVSFQVQFLLTVLGQGVAEEAMVATVRAEETELQGEIQILQEQMQTICPLI
jgi:hypothetical protein